MIVLIDRNARIREQLEQALQTYPEEAYQEEEGVLVKRVNQTQIYQKLQLIGRSQQLMGHFLLHLDDRITAQNGYKDELKSMQETIEQICTERIEACPVLPEVQLMREDFDVHVAEADKETLIATTTTQLKDKWRKEGQIEEQQRFTRAITIITTACVVLGALTAFITWIMGLWPSQQAVELVTRVL